SSTWSASIPTSITSPRSAVTMKDGPAAAATSRSTLPGSSVSARTWTPTSAACATWCRPTATCSRALAGTVSRFCLSASTNPYPPFREEILDTQPDRTSRLSLARETCTSRNGSRRLRVLESGRRDRTRPLCASTSHSAAPYDIRGRARGLPENCQRKPHLAYEDSILDH